MAHPSLDPKPTLTSPDRRDTLGEIATLRTIMETSEKPSIATVLEHYGADLSRVSETGWWSIRCPFTTNHSHGDRSKSASVNLDTGKFKCFGCGVEGDSYDLICEHEGVDFIGAKQWAEAELGIKGGTVRQAPARGRYRPSWCEDDG